VGAASCAKAIHDDDNGDEPTTNIVAATIRKTRTT
jgi:hypothetical protein